MRLRAMAKINLGLDVLRKREDGYHEVRMIMQTIQMYDLLDIRKKSEPGIELSTNLPYVPSDERNQKAVITWKKGRRSSSVDKKVSVLLWRD